MTSPPFALKRKKEYGNKALHFLAKADKKGMVPFEITYRVTRREVKTDVKANATLQPRATDKVSRFLEPDKLVPITGKPLTLLKDKKVPTGDKFAAAHRSPGGHQLAFLTSTLVPPRGGTRSPRATRTRTHSSTTSAS